MNNLVDHTTDTTINDALLEDVRSLYKKGMSWDEISIDLFGYKNGSSMKSKCNGNDSGALPLERVLRAMLKLSQMDIWLLHRHVIDQTKWRIVPINQPVEAKRTIKDLVPNLVFALSEIERGLEVQNADKVEQAERHIQLVLDRVHLEKVMIQNVLFTKIG
jgi:hypothetical protein